MHFAEPHQLLWLLLAIPIAALYLVTLVRRRQETATVALWAKALTRRKPWTVWRRWASLLLLLLVLAALVLTAAEPRFSAAGGARCIVLVIDVSASMRAVDVSPSRLAAAKDEARRILDSLAMHDRAAILSAGSLTRVHCGLTSEHAVLNHALAQVRATDGVTRLREAVDTARRLIAGVPNSQIVVLTDACFDDPQLAVAKDIRWLVHRGEAAKAANLAITRFEVRTHQRAPSQVQTLVEATNFGEAPVTVPLHVFVGNEEHSVVSLELPPRTAVQHELSIEIDEPALVAASLEVVDSLAADNLAQTAIAPRPIVNVVLDGETSDVLTRAIVADPLLRIVAAADREPPAGQTLRLRTSAKPETVTLFNRSVASGLPEGPSLVVAPNSDLDGLWRLRGESDGDAFVVGSLDHVSLGGVELGDVSFGQLVRLEFLRPATTLLASAGGEPIVSLLARTEGDVIVLHAPVEGGDLARHSEFPLLLAELLHRLAGGAAIDESSLDTGSTVAVSLRNLSKVARYLVSPDGRRVPLYMMGGTGEQQFVTLDMAGRWETKSLASPLGAGPTFVVSLLDPRESDLQTTAEVKSRPWDDSPQARVPLWIVVAVMALLLVAVDWTLYRRGVVE